MKKFLPFLLVFALFFAACGAKTAEVKDTNNTKAPSSSETQKKMSPSEAVGSAMDKLETTFGPMMDEFIKEKNITVPAGQNRMQYISEKYNNEWQDFMGAKAAKDPEFMKKMMEMKQ